MKQLVKSVTKPFLPDVVIKTVRHARVHLKEAEKLETRSIFEGAPDAPDFLGADMLETLQQRYPFPPEFGYDGKSLERRGLTRAAEILRLPGAREAVHFLELGCWDGMVSCILRRKGKNTTAIDNRSEGFDERAFREGVKLLRMDASETRFKDGSFDFVFSYDAFEHFARPERVLEEAIRVVRKGGHIYLAFGPLYMSPFGEHASLSITVPYCQFLFQKDLLNDFTIQKGLAAIDFDHVNGWSLEDYGKLWKAYSGTLEVIRYHEGYDLSHLDLIRRYPSCFKSKTDCFENLIVSSIEVLFRKS